MSDIPASFEEVCERPADHIQKQKTLSRRGGGSSKTTSLTSHTII